MISGSSALIVRRQRVAVHDVDVGLQEFPVAALLRAAHPPPALLDLVAAERELQLARVLQQCTCANGTVRSKCRPRV